MINKKNDELIKDKKALENHVANCQKNLSKEEHNCIANQSNLIEEEETENNNLIKYSDKEL
jgi:uncharacterized membrane-anchored protein YhcB (DUF1043 family)